MDKMMSGKARAKINIFLRILGLTENGYHDLFMLMQEIDIGDDIKMTVTPDGSCVTELADGSGIPAEKNLAYRAAEAYRKKTGISDRISMELTKKTPSQAGLGGGSSDAALVLNMLNGYYGNRLDMSDMTGIAASLGADVPFFINGGTALCEGIGERITALPSLSGLDIVLVKPPVGVDTGECYRRSDRLLSGRTGNDDYREQMLRVFGDGSMSPAEKISMTAGVLSDDLESAAVEMVPEIGKIVSEVAGTGALFASMTGSGSCVYGIYGSEEEACLAEKRLREIYGDDHFVMRTVTV